MATAEQLSEFQKAFRKALNELDEEFPSNMRPFIYYRKKESLMKEWKAKLDALGVLE